TRYALDGRGVVVTTERRRRMLLSIRILPGLAVSLGLLLSMSSTAGAQGTPDLVITTLGAPPATAFPGESFVVSVAVTNQGPAAADVSVTKFGLIGAVVKNVKGVQNVPALAPGATDSESVTLSIFSDTLPGTYTFGACANAGNISNLQAHSCRVGGTIT